MRDTDGIGRPAAWQSQGKGLAMHLGRGGKINGDSWDLGC